MERGRVAAADEAFTDAVRLDPSDHDTAEAAREVRVLRHWLLWPLRPAMRVGSVGLWLGAVVTMRGSSTASTPGPRRRSYGG